MEISLHHILIGLLTALGLFGGMLILLEIGRSIGLRRASRDPDASKLGTTAVDGAVFGLLGLLVAFTFSGAAARFDLRRQLIIDETNAINTAYRRLDLLSADAAAPLRENFRKYLDSRITTYREFNDLPELREELDRSKKLQDEIWNQAVAACKAQGDQATTKLLLPAINQMIDIMASRLLAIRMHPPLVVFLMLGGLALVSALLAGYGMSGSKLRSWIHMLAFATIMGVTVYVIIDIEFPRRGLIRIDAFDQALVELRESMK